MYVEPIEDFLSKIGLLNQVSIVYNALLRYRNGKTLITEVDNVSAEFYTGSAAEYAHLRNFWIEGLGGEKSILKSFLKDVEDGDVIYDVGANIWIYSCFANNVLSSGEIHAFEPHPDNASRLKHNLSIRDSNSLNRVHQTALSNESGTIALTIKNDVVGKGTHNILGNGSESIEVPTERMDEYVASTDISTPDILKIDVEGAEESVLLGGEDSISHARIVYIEVHPQYGASINEIKSHLNELGFSTETIGDRSGQPFLRAESR